MRMLQRAAHLTCLAEPVRPDRRAATQSCWAITVRTAKQSPSILALGRRALLPGKPDGSSSAPMAQRESRRCFWPGALLFSELFLSGPRPKVPKVPKNAPNATLYVQAAYGAHIPTECRCMCVIRSTERVRTCTLPGFIAVGAVGEIDLRARINQQVGEQQQQIVWPPATESAERSLGRCRTSVPTASTVAPLDGSPPPPLFLFPSPPVALCQLQAAKLDQTRASHAGSSCPAVQCLRSSVKLAGCSSDSRLTAVNIGRRRSLAGARAQFASLPSSLQRGKPARYCGLARSSSRSGGALVWAAGMGQQSSTSQLQPWVAATTPAHRTGRGQRVWLRRRQAHESERGSSCSPGHVAARALLLDLQAVSRFSGGGHSVLGPCACLT